MEGSSPRRADGKKEFLMGKRLQAALDELREAIFEAYAAIA